MSGHFVRFKLVEERRERNDEVEDADSRLGYLMRVSILAISFVEPKKPDPHHRREK
jgi:hypothetical protein